MPQRPASMVHKMLPIRGHTASGLKQQLTVRVYAPAVDADSGRGCIAIDGHAFPFASRSEAVAMFDEYFRSALERARAPERAPLS
jgi:hypothetical protein